MRPARLELQGFTAFREAVEVDFTDADLFALVGATGAGKTSVIDAMVFALYGTVPRLDRRAVAPVISTGKLEARVRFDFTVGDRAYTAARVVRRTSGGGATTKEARLEAGDGTVLAGDADGVTQTVTDLLGLGFDQFTKCVLLPQGDFSRFLHDKPRDRGDLLVRLLELGMYDRMREEAAKRQVTATSEASVIEGRLQDLGHATPQALVEAADRIAHLDQLAADVQAAEGHLDKLARDAAEARSEAEQQAFAVERLTGVAVPAEAGDLTASLSAAEAGVADADRAAADATHGVEQAEAAVAALPSRADLERIRERRVQHEDVTARMAKGERVVAERVQAAAAAEAAVVEAREAAASAEEGLAAAQREHAAHALAAHLVAGEPCPVCQQEVAAVTQPDSPRDLVEAKAELVRGRKAVAAVEAEARRRGEERAKAEQRMTELTGQRRELEQKLEGQPTLAETERLLEQAVEAEARLALAREHDRKARSEQASARESLAALRNRVAEAWATFDRVRDDLARFEPPPADRADLAGAWSVLAAWAEAEAARRQEQAGTAAARAASLSADAQREHQQLISRCAEHGVTVPAEGSSRDACADELARARAAHQQLKRDVEQAAALSARLTDLREQATVAGALARHLRADAFERWILDEALERLAAGASRVLRDLSGGQYSLAIDSQRGFAVVDHRNADEQRPARTLSGGETFLASLSLALSLAEHLADMAVSAAPRLESIFLDEGFGTLDPETLDVVAVAIEELGARGRTVGLVTHVRELADRMPVRYEVRRTASGSTVEQVSG